MAGIDVGVKVRQANPERGSTDPAFYRADQVLFAQGWLGQKSGRGYYLYEAGSRERKAHPQALERLRAEAVRLGIPVRQDISEREILERCLFSMINEGARVLEEGIALRPGDIDVVYTSGYGFPRHRGGPMWYADQIGLETVLAGLRRYGSAGHAPDWEPAPLLVQLAGVGSTFAAWQAARCAGV
jgi:3-hydroxyacyl-CoA dehydrogenase